MHKFASAYFKFVRTCMNMHAKIRTFLQQIIWINTQFHTYMVNTYRYILQHIHYLPQEVFTLLMHESA